MVVAPAPEAPRAGGDTDGQRNRCKDSREVKNKTAEGGKGRDSGGGSAADKIREQVEGKEGRGRQLHVKRAENSAYDIVPPDIAPEMVVAPAPAAQRA